MNPIRRLLKRTEKAPIAAMRGVAPDETQARKDGMRDHVETELAGDRKRRGATDIRPTRNKWRERRRGGVAGRRCAASRKQAKSSAVLIDCDALRRPVDERTMT